MSSQDISAIPFKSALDLARSESGSSGSLVFSAISLPIASDNGERNHTKSLAHGVLSTDLHNTNTNTPPSPAAAAHKGTPVAVPNLTKKARGRQVPTTKEALLKPGIAGRSYACKVENCRKVFTRSEHLKRHIRSIHTNERPFQCEEPSCGKYFTRHDNLLQHRRSHRGHTSTTHSGTSGPCDVPGPLERIYYTSTSSTTSTLARELHQPSNSQSILDISATAGLSSSSCASMGVLLPSPLTTVPASYNTRMTIGHGASASPPLQNKDTRPSTENQNYTHSHSARRGHSGSLVANANDLVHSAAIGTRAGGVPGNTAPSSSPTITRSTTSPVSPSTSYGLSDYMSEMNGNSANSGGTMPRIDRDQDHTQHDHSYFACYYEIERAHDRSPPSYSQPAYHGYNDQLYTNGGVDGCVAAPERGVPQYRIGDYQSQPPLVHISVPVGELADNKGSFFQWKI